MDICCTCIFQNNCTLRQRSADPIWDCSEFAVDTSETTPMPASGNHQLHEVAPRRRESKGLCQNCDLLETCSLYHQDAVIFHCEHYQ